MVSKLVLIIRSIFYSHAFQPNKDTKIIRNRVHSNNEIGVISTKLVLHFIRFHFLSKLNQCQSNLNQMWAVAFCFIHAFITFVLLCFQRQSTSKVTWGHGSLHNVYTTHGQKQSVHAIELSLGVLIHTGYIPDSFLPTRYAGVKTLIMLFYVSRCHQMLLEFTTEYIIVLKATWKDTKVYILNLYHGLDFYWAIELHCICQLDFTLGIACNRHSYQTYVW